MSIKNLGIKHIELNFDDNELGNLNLVANDTGTRGYAINLISANGEVLKPNPSYTVQLAGVNSNYPDKTYITDAVIEDGMYVVYLSTDMVSKDGYVSLQVFVKEGSSRLIQSEMKKVKVEKSLLGGGEAGKDLVVDFTKLSEAIERSEKLEASYKASLAEQEVIRTDVTQKHSQVTTMHSSLKGVLDKETERVKAEESRKQAEQTRQSQEQTRKQEETKRASAESTRKQQESTRQNQESTRQSNETKRKQDETTRQNQEQTRQQQETTRQSQEGTRKSQENAREIQELERQKQERTRQTQELDRVEAEETRKQKFDGWDKTMQGVIPPATTQRAGVVKIDKAGQDTAVSKETFNQFEKDTAGKFEYVKSETLEGLSQKVDKVSGKGLSTNDYTTAEKNKLSGIATGANKYTHPSTHPASMITETTSKRFVSDSEKSSWNNKAEKSYVDTSINKITKSSIGLGSVDNIKQMPISGGTFTGPAKARNNSIGTTGLWNIAVINSGASTSGIPNGTIILELE